MGGPGSGRRMGVRGSKFIRMHKSGEAKVGETSLVKNKTGWKIKGGKNYIKTSKASHKVGNALARRKGFTFNWKSHR